MKGWRLFSPLAVTVGLCGVMPATPASAISVISMDVRLDTNAGLLQQTGDLVLGGPATRGEVSVGVGDALAMVSATFEAAPIKSYTALFAGHPSFTSLTDTHWWAKLEAHIRYDVDNLNPNGDFPVTFVSATRTRGAERYAVYAVVPGSASGFATDAGPSTGGGPGFRLGTNVQFLGGVYVPNHGPGDPFPPAVRIGAGPGDTDINGDPDPQPDFNTVIMQYNQGFALTVDLDAAEVEVGDEYSFSQSYSILLGPGVAANFDELDLAFANFDPVVGFIIVPEPGTLTLLALGFVLLAPRLGRGRHMGSACRSDRLARTPLHNSD